MVFPSLPDFYQCPGPSSALLPQPEREQSKGLIWSRTDIHNLFSASGAAMGLHSPLFLVKKCFSD